MIKIISNKYFLFTLLFLCNCIAFAHDCSSPGDCEETAGYNAALAITGGVIALGAGLISTWMPPDIPDVPETDFENEFGEAFDDEFDDEFDEEFSDALDEGNEDEFDSDEDDEDDEYDEDEDDEDGKEEYDTPPKAKEPHVKEDVKKEVKVEGGNKGIGSVVLDKTQGIIDTSNNIKTFIQETGTAGVSIWRGILKEKHYGEATKRFYDIMNNLKNKKLNNLASKYAVKLNKLLKNRANSLIIKKTGAAKNFFKKLGNIESLGHLADGLTFLNNLNKKTEGGHANWDVNAGAVAEETVRFVFKTIVTKNPIVAVGDAALSLAGGPNLDYVVDKTLDNYKKGVTKITDWAYSDHKSSYAKLNSDFDFQKKRIEKMNLSPLEKGKKLRKVWKILKKSHQL